MKKFLLKLSPLFAAVFLFFACSNNVEKTNGGWETINDILKNIKQPTFADNEYNILDFGAKLDSTFNSKPAIQLAIDKCSENGGGTVLIPSGIYFSAGSIFLKSNVNLHLQDGAIINFSTSSKDYLPVVLSRWEGIECYNYSALIYAKDQENIAITGNGIFNGKASAENWWPWKGKTEYGFVKGMPSQLDSMGRPRLLKMNLEQTPAEERIFGEGFYLRPNFFQTINCKNILIEGVTFKDSPMWFLHPILSENITIRGVTVIGNGPNNDGCDPESCKNVLIENCNFNTGDDCIAIKSGRNNDGRRINVPSENFIIRNCKMKDGHGGVVIGSEISGGCKNIFAENCEMDSPNLDRAIRIKTNAIRGGTIENIYARNISVGEVKEAILKINLNYEPDEIGERNFPPTVKNIFIENVTSKKSEYAFYLDGLEESKINNVQIVNSKLDGVNNGNVLNNIENFKTNDVYINEKLFKN
ncbi:MAG: glycoside hydrolase family 28 protein [Ignavibacteriales bacterium]|nr:glycoside hydrolase family 28 protein [Ignavibacteriales bacterium]